MKSNKTGDIQVDGSIDVAEIYEKHHHKLRWFIAQRTSNKDELEDILQNVFYSLCKIDLLDNPIEHISSWLYSVTQNQIIDRQRKQKEYEMPQMRMNAGEEEWLADMADFLEDDENDAPDVRYLRSMVWEQLDISLEKLPEEQRNVFEMTELQGFSFKYISDSTGIPVNTLISRKRYAVVFLREELSELYLDLIE